MVQVKVDPSCPKHNPSDFGLGPRAYAERITSYSYQPLPIRNNRFLTSGEHSLLRRISAVFVLIRAEKRAPLGRICCLGLLRDPCERPSSRCPSHRPRDRGPAWQVVLYQGPLVLTSGKPYRAYSGCGWLGAASWTGGASLLYASLRCASKAGVAVRTE